ncbi:MAG: sensor histidine kinase [Kineosporiaceae bacterium]
MVSITRPRRPVRPASVAAAGSPAVATVSVVLLAALTGLGMAAQLSAPTGRTTGGFRLPVWLVALTLAAAVAVVGASVLTMAAGRRHRASWGLVLLLAGLVLPAWAGWPGVPAEVAPLLLAFAPLTVAGVAAVAADRAPRAVLPLSALAGAMLALGYDPFADLACFETCTARPAPLAALVSTHAAITAAGVMTLAASGLASLGLWPAEGAPRWIRGPAATALALLAAALVIRLTTPSEALAQQAQRTLPALAVIVVAGSLATAEARAVGTRKAMERLVAGLSAPESVLMTPGSRVTGVLFAVPGSVRWVDATGTEMPPPDGPHLIVSDAGEPAVRLQLSDRGAEPGVLAALTPAARLALRNAQLTAAGRARLAEVRASRRRIISTSDAERRRIERDLHDGAQQRLVSVALHLQVALARVAPPAAGALRDAESGVREALVRLRRLAHGVLSTALADDGLDTALEELADASPLPLTLDVSVGAELDAEAGMAAYTTVTDALRAVDPAALPPGSSVAVRIRRAADVLTLRLDVPASATMSTTSTAQTAVAVGDALGEAADRVAAIGGTLSVAAGDGGVEVTAVIPCGS